jgi:hypothetical protein
MQSKYAFCILQLHPSPNVCGERLICGCVKAQHAVLGQQDLKSAQCDLGLCNEPEEAPVVSKTLLTCVIKVSRTARNIHFKMEAQASFEVLAVTEDFEVASRKHPEGLVLYVTADPSRKHHRVRRVGVIAAWVEGSKVRKQAYYQRRQVAMRFLMKHVLGNFSNCWERQLYCVDAATMHPLKTLASEVIGQHFDMDPVSRQTNSAQRHSRLR